MADLRFGISFQAERLALIREIARNLGGETRPAGTGIVGAGPAGGVAAPDALDVAETDDGLLADRMGPREGQAATPAERLAGLRLPQPMFLEAQAYRQVLARLAASDPVLAAIAGGEASSEASPAHPAGPAAGGAALPDASDASPGVPVHPVADPDSGAASSSPLEAASDKKTAAVATPSGSGLNGSAALDVAPSPGASAIVTPQEAAVIEARAATEAVLERALAGLNLADGAAAATAMRAELGGIIASFILNAHFQPGWPPLRPVQDAEAKAVVAQLARDAKLSKDDTAMLTYLANFGLNRTQLLRILKLVAAATNRSKLLQAIVQLFAGIGTVLGAVRTEIEALAAELREADAGQARRERLPLR